MKNRHGRERNVIRFFLVAAVIFYAALAGAGDMEEMQAGFEQFRNEANEFEAYKKSVHEEFQQYKRIIAEEFKQYRRDILKNWDRAEVTHKKKFVEYTDGYKTKKVVDFEKGYMEISVIVPKGEKEPEKILDKKLADLIVEDNVVALSRDQFSKNVEKRLTEASPEVKKAKVKRVPIVADILTGTATPSKEKVKEVVRELKKEKKVTKKPSPKVAGSEVVTIKVKLPSDRMKKKALSYMDSVRKYTAERDLDPALVLAVMQTESAFNPMARSYVPAYGLMQIVPKSAGIDASQHVFGEKRVLSPSFLYDGENNINMGTAYIQILWTRYLRAVKNEESRLYCVIAAYNTGAGNVSRAFIGNTSIRKAAKTINRMTPDEVYNRLIEHLPHDETKNYVKRVSSRMKLYEKI